MFKYFYQSLLMSVNLTLFKKQRENFLLVYYRVFIYFFNNWGGQCPFFEWTKQRDVAMPRVTEKGKLVSWLRIAAETENLGKDDKEVFLNKHNPV